MNKPFLHVTTAGRAVGAGLALCMASVAANAATVLANGIEFMMKLSMMLFVAMLSAASPLMADEWYDSTTGYTWTYNPCYGYDVSAFICGYEDYELVEWEDGFEELISLGWRKAVSPEPSGVLEIPTFLAGLPLTEIGDYSFLEFGLIETVIIPETVKHIGDGAFCDCSSLEEVSIPDSVISIGSDAFAGCSDFLFDTTTIPGVKLVDGWAFEATSSIKNELDLTRIRGICDYAFYDCDILTDVTIPVGVTSLGSWAFSGCSKLASVTIPNSVTEIGYGSFYGNSGLTSIVIPDSVTSIEGEAFSGCSGLTSVTIPNSVRSIGSHAFDACSGLTSVTIGSGVSSIGSQAFFGCNKLTSFAVSNNNPNYKSEKGLLLTKDGTTLVAVPNGQTKVTIPDSVTDIGSHVFDGCSGLTMISIPECVQNIGEYAFHGCCSLESVIIPTSVTNIGSHAFDGCSGLATITIGNNVMRIGNYAFNNCSRLTTLTIPDVVESIGDHAFRGCTNTTCLTIGAGMTSIDPFRELSAVNDIAVSADNSAFMSASDGVVFTKDGRTLVLYPRGRAGNYAVPDGVDTIADSAFAGCTRLTGVSFPESLLDIGPSAFDGCSALVSVDFANGVTKIKRHAFRNCSSLSSLIVPESVIALNEGVFSGCTSLANLVLPVWLQSPSKELGGTISGTTTLERGTVYYVSKNLTIADGATLTIPSGTILKMASDVSITVNGTLNAQGTRSSPIIFTSVKDDSVGGDTNGDGEESHPQAGDWARIYAGGTVAMDYCRIRYCNNNSDNGAIHGTGGSVTFDNGIIEFSVYECVRMNSGRFIAHNSIFRESSMGFGYYGGLGTYAYNCIVADCSVGCRAGGKYFYNTVFYNCKAFSDQGGDNNTFRNCLFFNEQDKIDGADKFASSYVKVGSNGNVWGDPQFVDNDFRISADSPCVDAGDGAVAPATDYFGQTRQNVYEDATGTPDANCNIPDIGIHEVMPRDVKSDIDLAVENVSAPDEMVVGEKTTVSWTVKNHGSEAATGAWNDTVELVCANGSVVALGALPISATIPAGGVRMFTGTWTVPSAQVGAVRVRVTANANRDIFEGTLTANNTAESEAVTLTLPELALPGSGVASFNLAAGGSIGHRLGDGFENGGLLIVRTVGGGSSGSVGVWTGNGQVPTADIFYGSAVQVADGVSIVQVPAGGDAYVAVANAGGGPARVEIEAETGGFLLFDTGITTAPNDGMVNLTLYGNGFADDMEVWIEKNGSRVDASDLVVFDALRVTATFDVTGLAPGDYELHFRRGGEEVSANLLALTQQKVGPKWSCKLDIASAIRSSREYVGYLEYANTGDMPLDAPYVKITAGSGSFIRFGSADAWGDTLELMATSETYPASQLKPGETRRIPFRYKTTGSSLSVECGYTQDDPGAFPWNTNASYMCPSWASDELWGLSLAVLKSNVGATWNDYLARMRANCDHLAKIGQPTYRLDRIWQLEINEALGVDHAVSTLASNTDLARSGRGFGLALSRSYGSGLYRRLRKGIFGYGWSDNYSAYAELQNSGTTLALHSGSGSTYLFEKVNGTWTPEDARDKTTCTETSTEYVLAYRSGTVQRIAKSNMRVTSVKDNQGNMLTFTYNADKTLARVAHCDGQSLSFAYANGLLISATDDQGRTTRYEYSGDLLVKVTAFNGLATQYNYHATNGSVTSRALRQIVYADGTTRDYTYDGAGRVATVAINGNQQMVEIVRGALGSYTVVAPNGGETTVTLGASGEVLETVNALGQKSTRTYTADTLLEAVVGPTGKRAKIGYDEDGQAVKATDAAGADTHFAYTSDFGNLAKVTDARGNSFDYGYDKLGRSKSISYADGSIESIAYNDRGDVTNSVNRRGQSIAFTYDNEGNTLSKVWDDGRTFTCAYDAKGNCTNATDSATGAVTMEYDENERLTRIVHPKGRGFAYEYDSLGRTVSRTTLGGTGSVPSAADIQRYTYDSLGRLARMTDGDGNLYVENAYDPVTGWLVTQTYGNGTVVSNAYDILGRTVGIYHLNRPTVQPSNRQTLAFFEYAYDAEGRRISQTTAEGVERYTYDTVGQLTDVYYPDGTEEHFTYDAVGNRITSGGEGGSPAEISYTANNLNQYTSVGETSFTYDLDGNMTRKGDTLYYYDIQNRLVAVTNTTKDIAWSCEYDVFGNRTKVIDHGTAKETLFMQGSLASAVAEFDASGDLSTRHILLGSVRLASLTTHNSQLTTSYYYADGLASTRLLTDGNGDTIGTASYNAFGSIRTTGGSLSPATAPSAGWVGTLGVERDDATGLVFMRNRYFDAEQGRFIQMDPIGILGRDFHFYRYCMNNPNNYVDHSGLSGVNGVGCNSGRIPTRVASGDEKVQPVSGTKRVKKVSIWDDPGENPKKDDGEKEGNEDTGENGEDGGEGIDINASVETREKVRKVGQAGLVIGGTALGGYIIYKSARTIAAGIFLTPAAAVVSAVAP